MRKALHSRRNALVLAVAGAAGLAFAQQAPSAAVEPDAIATLLRMGAYLRTQKAVSVRADTTIDEVTDDGMKLQFGGTVTIKALLPDRLYAAVESDRRRREWFYDGRTLTLYGPRVGYYATVAAPETLRELADDAERNYGVHLPLDDLFRWGADDSWRTQVTEAALIGPAQIGGRLCDHVAVRQPGVDWQVWVEQGDRPMPCKLVITTTSEPAQPAYTALLHWETAPAFDAATFTFVPPQGARRIEMTQGVQP